MSRVLEAIVTMVGIAVVAVVVFVRAGEKSGVSGGQQVEMMAVGAGQGFSASVAALEGGS